MARSAPTATSETRSATCTILKLNDEEAETLVGSAEPEALQSLGVPEVLLTLGSKGSCVITPGAIEHVPALEVAGAGRSHRRGRHLLGGVPRGPRAAGAEPVEAARIATETVAAFLSGDG